MPIFVEHWGGDNWQFYPNFVLFSTLGEMNLDHDFFQVSKLSEDQKKGLHLKKENFVPQILVETCAQMHTKVKLLGGCRCRLYSNYWGSYSQIGGYISPSPLGFGTPVGEKMKQRQTKVEETDLLETIIRVEAQNKA